MRNLLFDASSLILALKLGKVELLQGNYLQWLTIYEAVNALWKEAHLVRSLSQEEVFKLAEVLEEIVGLMEILALHPHEHEVLQTATRLKLTAYDASYIVLAENQKLTLVTEDRKLREAAQPRIKAVSLNDLLKTAKEKVNG